MKAHSILLPCALLCAWLASAPAQAADILSRPTHFVRSGVQTWVPLDNPAAPAAVHSPDLMLFAYGRPWSPAMRITRSQNIPGLFITAPQVRVPTVFSLLPPAGHPDQTLGPVIVYPPQDLPWDPSIGLYALSPPPWFREWAAANGLPISLLETPRPGETARLLILGIPASGDTPAHAQTLATHHKANILVLQATWFGPPAAPFNTPFTLEPKHIFPPLPKPTRPIPFPSRFKPCSDQANAISWAQDADSIPFIQHLLPTMQDTGHVTASYLPWQYALGQSSDADDLFLNLLNQSARPTPVPLPPP